MFKKLIMSCLGISIVMSVLINVNVENHKQHLLLFTKIHLACTFYQPLKHHCIIMKTPIYHLPEQTTRKTFLV